MLKKFAFILILLFAGGNYFGQSSLPQKVNFFKVISSKRNVDLNKRNTKKHSKLVAAGLNISLGIFGVHRLYLGTSPQVPVIYTFTLGGGGFLMLSDLGVIIFTKDLEQFSDNPKVIMWNIE